MIIPEYFTDSEISCRCGCGLMPDTRSIEMLYALRLLMRKPLRVTSGARCEAHNKAVGGSVNSTHLIGAFDIVVHPLDEWEFIQRAQFIGFTGIGFNDNTFMHIDRHRKNPTVWGY